MKKILSDIVGDQKLLQEATTPIPEMTPVLENTPEKPRDLHATENVGTGFVKEQDDKAETELQ